MPVTTTYLMPYPVLTDTPDVPRDIRATADRLEAYLVSVNQGRPTFIVRAGASAGNFGASVWQQVGGVWVKTASSPLGRPGVFSYGGTGSTITVLEAGLYHITWNLEALQGNPVSTGMEGRVWHVTDARTLTQSSTNQIPFAMSGATTCELAANDQIRFEIWNASGFVVPQADGGAYANTMTIMKVNG